MGLGEEVAEVVDGVLNGAAATAEERVSKHAEATKILFSEKVIFVGVTYVLAVEVRRCESELDKHLWPASFEFYVDSVHAQPTLASSLRPDIIRIAAEQRKDAHNA